MMPDPTALAPAPERDPHRSTLKRAPDVAAWDALHAAEIDCGEAEAALRCVDAADDQLGYAFAVSALAGHGHVYATATARRCVVCDQPDTGAAA